MSITLANQDGSHSGAGSGASDAFTLTFTPTQGNVLVMLAGTGAQTGRVSSISQSGVTWHQATGAPSVTNRFADAWYGEVGSSPSTSVTVNWSPNTAAVTRYSFSEWSGVATTSELDPANFLANAATNTVISTASITPTASRECVVLALGTKAGTFSSGPTASFTALTTPNTGVQFAYLIVGSTSGSYSTTWTFATSTAYDAGIFVLLAPTSQDTPELYGRPYGQRGQAQMQQLLAS